MDFYDRFIQLCAKKGVKPCPMLESIGIQKTAATNWKKRRNYPTPFNLRKIADYFEVSVEYLKGETENPSVDNDKGEDVESWTVYAMDGEKAVDTVDVNIDTLAYITELVEVVRKLPKEKILAILNIAKYMK